MEFGRSQGKTALDMKIYCSHLNKTITKSSNYIQCHFCGYGWYGTAVTPLVIIGYTDAYEASPNYHDGFVEKDLSKKKFSRCAVCHDLLEKRKHRLCTFKVYLKEFRKRHDEFVENVMIVVRGFKRDK